MKISTIRIIALITLAVFGFATSQFAFAGEGEGEQVAMSDGMELPPKTKGQCYFPQSDCEEGGIPAPAPAAPAPAPEPVSFGGNGWGTESIGYNIFIEKHFPKTVYSGQPYTYTIEVTNLSDIPLENVNIIETFPASFKVISTDPEIYDTKGDKVAWALGQMGAKEKRIITVTGMASGGGQVPCCTYANFKHPDLCLNTDVIDPGLRLNVSAPREVLRCDNIPLEYVVENSGQSALDNVMVLPNMPSAVASAEGQATSLPVGNLSMGESKNFNTVVGPLAPGSYTFSGVADGMPAALYEGHNVTNGVKARSGSVDVRVLNPELKVTASTRGSSKQIIGRKIEFNFNVTNTGNGTADASTLMASIPANSSFHSATDEGTYGGGTVTWNLGNMAPSATKNVSMVLVANGPGEAAAMAEVTGVCVVPASASASVPVVGVAALLLEAIDSVDPLEIGDSTQYEIRVTNQGNGPATNVQLTGEFEAFNFVSASGHTPIENVGKNLTMGTFSLEPKQTVSWIIQLEAAGVGDQRFTIIMNSDQLGRPVQETESTTIY